MKKISRRKFIKGGLLAAVGLILLDMFWFEKYIIDWNYFNFSKNEKSKIKIVQITDLHMHSLQSFHKSIAEKINDLQPDLIFITGDSVDKSENIDALEELMKLIDPSISKIAIVGNWEYWGNVDLGILKNMFLKYNCDLLINENKSFKIKARTISIIGMDDLIGGNPDIEKATANLPKDGTKITLAHCPQHRDFIISEEKNLKIDLVLSGHTHGGQVNIFGFVPFKPPGSGKYLKGWYKDEGLPPMYVSKGIGTSLFHIRFGARAEVVEMDI